MAETGAWSGAWPEARDSSEIDSDRKLPLPAFEEQAEPPWLFGATDLMVAWKPEQAGQWDRFFSQPAAVENAPHPQRAGLDPEAAEAAVDCLFRFVHAIEQRDPAEAVACLAADYHTFEDEREVDRDGFRLRLEAQLERWGDELRVSLAEVPDPILHPAAILIPVTIQVDYRGAEDRRPRTDVIARIAVFRRAADGRWLIGGLSPAC